MISNKALATTSDESRREITQARTGGGNQQVYRRTLSSTNPMESANSVCVGVLRGGSNFRDGKMTLRHAAGFLEAERGFGRIIGYRQISILVPC